MLAPMADVTNLPYRILAKRYGADITFTEMISSKTIEKKIDLEKMQTNDEDNSFAQIFGSDPKELAKAAKILERDFDGIDINMGCPAPKIYKNGFGSALLKDPNLIKEIVKEVRKAIEKPLSIKIRLGFDVENYEEVIRAAEDYVDFITIHARLTTQGYSGSANWEAIKRAKKISKVPIVGNGDIKSYSEAKRLIKEGYCDAVMVGRQSYKNMNVFSSDKELTRKESVDLIDEYHKLWKKYSGDIFKLRFFSQWTLKDKHIKSYRRKINHIRDEKELMNLIHNGIDS